MRDTEMRVRTPRAKAGAGPDKGLVSVVNINCHHRDGYMMGYLGHM